MAFMIDIYSSMEDREINDHSEKKEFIDLGNESIMEDNRLKSI